MCLERVHDTFKIYVHIRNGEVFLMEHWMAFMMAFMMDVFGKSSWLSMNGAPLLNVKFNLYFLSPLSA